MSAPVLLQRQQLDRLWDIDRSEIIDTLYRLQDGKLQAYPDYYDVRGWDPHDRETYTPIHEACFDRGGAFFARFEGEEIVAAAALDTEPRGPQRICASCCSLRQRAQTRPGLGKQLFQLCLRQAAQEGAAGLYVSSIPNKSTVDFYLAQGCRLIERPDAELFAREPEDIHWSALAVKDKGLTGDAYHRTHVAFLVQIPHLGDLRQRVLLRLDSERARRRQRQNFGRVALHLRIGGKLPVPLPRICS